MSALLFEKNGLVVTLTINRPESRNPLGEDGDGALFADAAARINADREVRCVIPCCRPVLQVVVLPRS